MATAARVSPAVDLTAANERLSRKSAEERIAWALSEFPGELVVSTSFGVQAVVMLGLAAAAAPDLPVVMIDTGYLFPRRTGSRTS